MTEPDPGSVSRLLTEAEDAHGVYENDELNGVYDEAWAGWYAAYLVEHGIAALLGRAITADQLRGLLADGFDQYRAEGSEAGESWADWTARQLVDDSRIGA